MIVIAWLDSGVTVAVLLFLFFASVSQTILLNEIDFRKKTKKLKKIKIKNEKSKKLKITKNKQKFYKISITS